MLLLAILLCHICSVALNKDIKCAVVLPQHKKNLCPGCYKICDCCCFFLLLFFLGGVCRKCNTTGKKNGLVLIWGFCNLGDKVENTSLFWFVVLRWFRQTCFIAFKRENILDKKSGYKRTKLEGWPPEPIITLLISSKDMYFWHSAFYCWFGWVLIVQQMTWLNKKNK